MLVQSIDSKEILTSEISLFTWTNNSPTVINADRKCMQMTMKLLAEAQPATQKPHITILYNILYHIVVINVRKKIKNVNKRVFYEKKNKKTFVNVIKKRYPIFTCF